MSKPKLQESITVECPHCGSQRRYIGDPANSAQWRLLMAGKVCATCDKPLAGKRERRGEDGR